MQIDDACILGKANVYMVRPRCKSLLDRNSWQLWTGVAVILRGHEGKSGAWRQGIEFCEIAAGWLPGAVGGYGADLIEIETPDGSATW